MPTELSGFTNEFACFVAEFVGLAVLVSVFVLAQYHHAWRVSTLRRHSKPAELHQAH